MNIYRNISEHALTGKGWLLKDKEFNAKDVVDIEELIVWLQETFGNADNINLILNELGRLKGNE